jgi:two-component system probable response regulator PhcQ
MMRRYLLVDDEINILNALRRSLHPHMLEENVRIETYTEAQQALLRMHEVPFDLVISDYRMPRMDGIAFLKRVKSIQPDAVRLMLSSSDDFETVLGAINEAEVFRYVSKPWDIAELLKIIELGMARRTQAIQARHLADELRVASGQLTPEEAELKRLEESEPGITKVNWGPDGSVLLDFPEPDAV